MSNALGLIGVVCFLTAYFLLQTDRAPAKGLTYLGLNLLGAVLVMISLLFAWNLPAFLLEALWALISMYGIYRHVWKTRIPPSS